MSRIFFCSVTELREKRDQTSEALFQFVEKSVRSNKLEWKELGKLLKKFLKAQTYLSMKTGSEEDKNILKIAIKIGNDETKLDLITYESQPFGKIVAALTNLMPNWRRKMILAEMSEKRGQTFTMF